MVEPSDTPAPTDGGAPPAPEAPPEVPKQDDDFAYLDAAQQELMDVIPDDASPVEPPPPEPPPVEIPPVAEPPPPVVPPVEEPPPEVPPVAPPLTPAAPPSTVEDENKQLRAQLAAITDQMNRMAGLDKVGAYDLSPPAPGAPPLDPAVPPPAPGVYTPPGVAAPPMAPAAPPHAAVPITVPSVSVAPEVLPEGFGEMAEPLTRISQTLVNQVYQDMDAKIDQKLNSLVESSRYVAGVNKRFYESYPALSPYRELVGQIAAPYEAHIIRAPQQGLDASVYFAPIAQRAVSYLTAQGITVDPTQVPAGVPGSPPTSPSPHPGAARATAPVGAARTGAAVSGELTQHDYMNLLG